MTLPGRVPLHGWLDQGDQDPLAGHDAVAPLLAGLLGLERLEHTPAPGFDPASLRPSRLSGAQVDAIARTVGADGLLTGAVERAAASLGQGYIDQWLRRCGRVEAPVDAVVAPASLDAACAVLAWCARERIRAQCVGGATGVVGPFAVAGDPVRIALSSRRLTRVRSIDVVDRLVDAASGIGLAALDAALAEKGLLLGHEPQSYHGATLGGALAAHGSGQRSKGQGRMSDLIVSARVATPSGPWSSEPFREAATGPWLGGLVVGSEGALGLVCDAVLRVVPKPQVVSDTAFLFPHFEAGLEATRSIVQSGAPLSMVRLSDADETLLLGRFSRARRAPKRSDPWIDRWLRWRGVRDGACLLLVGVDGDVAAVRSGQGVAAERARRFDAVAVGTRPGLSWRHGRFDGPYLREALLARGLGIETVETATRWSSLAALHAGVRNALTAASRATLAQGRPHVMAHVSHAYAEGASLYFTVIFPRDADDPVAQWQRIKAAAQDAITLAGAVLSHHHGIGAEHARGFASAKGEIGARMVASLRASVDPAGVLLSPGFDAAAAAAAHPP